MRAAWSHWFAVACCAAAGPVAAQPAAAPAPADADTTGFVLPPLQMSGTLTYTERLTRMSGGASQTSHLVTGAVSARTFIYAPWLATVNGTLRLSVDRSRSKTVQDTGTGSLLDSESRNQFASGSLQVQIFPRSRFPIDVQYDRGDSRSDSGLTPTIAYVTQAFRLSQRYRPEDNSFSGGARYEWRTQSGAGFRDVQHTLDGDIGTEWKYNRATLGVTLSRVDSGVSADRSSYFTAVGRHDWTPALPLSLNTTVNVTRTRQGGSAESDVSAGQFSSVGVWRVPDTPLSVSGSLRGLVVKNSLNGNSIASLSGSVGSSYQLGPRLNVAGSLGIGVTQSNDSQSTNVSSGLTASWQAEPMKILGFAYDRSVSGNLGLAYTTGTGITQTLVTLNPSIGHSLNRQWQLTPDSDVQLSASQNLAASYSWLSPAPDTADPLPSNPRPLLTNVSATWNVRGANKSAYARISYSDSIDLGGSSARFQLANFQVSGTWEFGRFRSLTGDLTLQQVRQKSDANFSLVSAATVPLRMRSHSASGQLTYQDGRFMNVRGLRLTSQLNLAQDVLNQAGSLPGLPVHETAWLENRLGWTIGRLDSSVLYRISRVEDRTVQFLFFSVQRGFGN